MGRSNLTIHFEFILQRPSFWFKDQKPLCPLSHYIPHCFNGNRLIILAVPSDSQLQTSKYFFLDIQAFATYYNSCDP